MPLAWSSLGVVGGVIRWTLILVMLIAAIVGLLFITAAPPSIAFER